MPRKWAAANRLVPLLLALALLATWAGCARVSRHLTVRVVNEEGVPIPGATIVLAEKRESQAADATGTATWSDLDQSEVSLVVTASGYGLGSAKVTLERSSNQTVVVLEREAVPYQFPSP